jgi:hypothetical protein
VGDEVEEEEEQTCPNRSPGQLHISSSIAPTVHNRLSIHVAVPDVKSMQGSEIKTYPIGLGSEMIPAPPALVGNSIAMNVPAPPPLAALPLIPSAPKLSCSMAVSIPASSEDRKGGCSDSLARQVHLEALPSPPPLHSSNMMQNVLETDFSPFPLKESTRLTPGPGAGFLCSQHYDLGELLSLHESEPCSI